MAMVHGPLPPPVFYVLFQNFGIFWCMQLLETDSYSLHDFQRIKFFLWQLNPHPYRIVVKYLYESNLFHRGAVNWSQLTVK
jgi:hypothetical protein